MKQEDSVHMAPEISETGPDRKDPDWMYRRIGTGISTRPDENCGRGDYMDLVG